jgi:hypothetical protein
MGSGTPVFSLSTSGSTLISSSGGGEVSLPKTPLDSPMPLGPRPPFQEGNYLLKGCKKAENEDCQTKRHGPGQTSGTDQRLSHVIQPKKG